MNYWKKDGQEEKVFQGNIVEVTHQPMKLGDKKMTFEKARRAPGVRLLIIKKNKILITKEYRDEIGEFDYRLPGGKVFDKLEEYQKNSDGNMMDFAIKAAEWEAREEAGIIIKSMEHIVTSYAGSTIVWDLYYFLIKDSEDTINGQEVEDGEEISVEWKTFEEVKELCLENKITEDRTVAVLLKYILKNNL